jgi:hypothetical protein
MTAEIACLLVRLDRAESETTRYCDLLDDNGGDVMIRRFAVQGIRQLLAELMAAARAMITAGQGQDA